MSNPFEQFPSAEKLKEIEVERQKKIIEEAALSLEKEYGSYEEVVLFIRYLRDFQYLLMRFPSTKDSEEFKEEYIKMEISSISAQAKMDPVIFNVIYQLFKKKVSLESIEEIVDELLSDEKYSGDKDCREFILHVGRIYRIFIENDKSDPKELREEIIQEKIKELSSDGVPPEEKLNEILKNFDQRLIEKNILKQKEGR